MLRRRPEMSESEFATYWRGKHAEVVTQHLPDLNGYVQNLVVDRSQKGIDYERGAIEVDGLAQLTFPTIAETRDMAAPEVLAALQADENEFLSSLSILTAIQNTVITPPRSGKFVKRMSFLRKLPGVSNEEFQRQWFEMHAIFVRRLPGIMGYRQNLVIDRQGDRFDGNNLHDANHVNGVVELWFESTDAIETAFRSPIGITTMTHAREFIGEISTYMVESTEIIPEVETF
jgi:uncharacterized protein (TIGR02118 family)